MSGELPKEDLEFLVKLTGKTEKEVKNYYKLFQMRHPTGKIEMKEFTEKIKDTFRESFIGRNPDAFCKCMFRVYDIEENGCISFREAVLAMYICRNDGPKEEKIKFAFRNYDVNKNGEIDKKEMLDCISGLMTAFGDGDCGVTLEESVKSIMDNMDTNKDGVINEAEFIEACSKDEIFFRGLCRFWNMFAKVLQYDIEKIKNEQEHLENIKKEELEASESVHSLFTA